MSKPKTDKDAAQLMLDMVWQYIHYWDQQAKREKYDTRRALEGLGFSFMCILDGEGNEPGFSLTVEGQEDSKQEAIMEDEDYWPTDTDTEGEATITTCLHEHFHNRGKNL